MKHIFILHIRTSVLLYSRGDYMIPNLDWNKNFQEFQEILNSGINPEWLYNAKANMILNPAYTGEGKQFFFTKDIIKASKTIPFF